ncbi:MAG TPA: hypothetical protein VGX95_12355 [Xanthobacteraceae bacterium]|nr:hypothetical protein [Xanthobacteraceae bacterium]
MASIDKYDVLRDEANAIHGDQSILQRLERSALYRALFGLNSSALCISGGGIRSASFSQGVIEALACVPIRTTPTLR